MESCVCHRSGIFAGGRHTGIDLSGERQKEAIEELSKDLNVATILPCDVTKDDDLEALQQSLWG